MGPGCSQKAGHEDLAEQSRWPRIFQKEPIEPEWGLWFLYTFDSVGFETGKHFYGEFKFQNHHGENLDNSLKII